MDEIGRALHTDAVGVQAFAIFLHEVGRNGRHQRGIEAARETGAQFPYRRQTLKHGLFEGVSEHGGAGCVIYAE